jgi:hypothetical protein
VPRSIPSKYRHNQIIVLPEGGHPKIIMSIVRDLSVVRMYAPPSRLWQTEALQYAIHVPQQVDPRAGPREVRGPVAPFTNVGSNFSFASLSLVFYPSYWFPSP